MKDRKLIYGMVLFTGIIVMLTVLWVCMVQIEDSDRGESEELFLIGVSQPNLTEPRQIEMYNEIKEEIEKHPNVRVIFTDAAQNSQKQIDDVGKLMEFGIDLLIISLNDSDALTPVVAKAYQEIPVIVLGRGVTGYDYTLFIGPENHSIGRKSGQLALEILGDRGGEILEIRGPTMSPSVSDTSLGFREIVNKEDSVRIVKTITADWQRDKAEDEVLAALPEHPDIQLIFAHSDAMALGAYRAAKRLGREDDIHILGIDGLSNEDGGLALVQRGEIDGTFSFPTGGKEAVQYALEILEGVKGIPKKIILRSHQITADNVEQVVAGSQESSPKGPQEEIVLGFVQVGTESEWRMANTESIISAAEEAGIKLLHENAEGSQKKQIEIIRHFIRQKVDVIAFSPKVETGWEAVLQEAKSAAIPVITSDRKVRADDSLWTAFIGSDFEEEGRRAARWIVENTKDVDGPVNIVEIQGTKGSAPAIGRGEGFRQVLKGNPRYNIISSPLGDFTFESGKALMGKVLQVYGRHIGIVYAHNDDMALGAIEAIEAYGLRPGKDIKLISVDATEKGLKAINAGKLNAAVECNPLLGPPLMKVIKDLMDGKEIPINIITEEGMFTAENAKQELSTRTY